MQVLDRPSPALASLLGQSWKSSPASTAARWSAGSWVRTPHLNLISDEVSRIFEEPVRLIISMPPRHGKSYLISLWTVIWYLSNWPAKRVGLGSYSTTFASYWGRHVRSEIRRNPGLGLQVNPQADRAIDWELETGGGMLSSGMGGQFTGRGFDLLIVDDPIKTRQEANSATYRQTVWDWWTSTAHTRLQPGGSIVVVMTRWHEDDLVGRLLDLDFGDEVEAEDWRYIKLPALAEEDDLIGRPEGEPLWPARYDLNYLRTERIIQGPYSWAGLYQQRPVELGGGIFKVHWWQYEDTAKLPGMVTAPIQFWDTAFKLGQENDYSACATIYAGETTYVLKEMYRGRLEFPDLIQAMIMQAERHSPSHIYVEDAASGQSAVQALRAETRLPIVPVPVGADKVSRANAVTGIVEAKKVILPRGMNWVDPFIDEICAFPNGAHDDQVDAFVGALTQLGVMPVWTMGPADPNWDAVE